MTAYSWLAATSGDWNSASSWSPTSGSPDSGDSVTVGVAGSAYTITVDSADAAGSVTLSSADAVLAVDGTAGSLTVGGTFGMSAGVLDIATSSTASGALTVDGAFTNSGGTLDVDDGGTLTLGATLAQTAGTLDLNSGATISGGVIDVTGGSVGWDGGALSGVTYDGPLNLTSSSVQQSVHLANGSKVVGSSGSGAGTIDVTGYYAFLYFDNTQTVSNVTINLGGSGDYDYLESYDSTGAGDKVLTLASSVTVDASGSNNNDITAGGASDDAIVNQGVINQTGSNFFGIGGDTFTNDGTIDAAGSGAEVYIETTNFTNNDALNVSNGDTVDIDSANFSTTSASAITVGANSTLVIDPGSGSWSNLGRILVASGATADLYGALSAATLGSFTNSGGTVDIAGNYANTGETLNGAASFGQLTLDGGTITGGVATGAGVAFSSGGGTLSGVTYDGPLNLTSTSVSQAVDLTSGTTVVGSSGSGAGTINVTGYDSILYFGGAQTVSNVTINLGGYGADNLESYYSNLTLASSVTVNASVGAVIAALGSAIVNQGVIQQTGSSALYIEGDTFTNGGTIDAAGSDSAVEIFPTNFTNDGVLNVSNGDIIDIAAMTFTNLAANTLTGGTYDIGAGSTLEVDGEGKITTLDANVILSGTGSQFDDYYSGSTGTPELDTLLTTIGGAGELQLLAGRNWTTANAAITNEGVIELGGGTITSTGTSASLTDATGSRLAGYGTVTATTFSNSGTIEASGGMLTLTDAVRGTGALQIDANADLVVGGAIASGATATFSGDDGLLTLDAPGSFGAAVGGFSLIDTIDLVGVTGNAARIVGNQLVVSDNGTTVDTIDVNGAYGNVSFAAVPATSGPAGTDIIAVPTPATVADYLAAVSDYDLVSGGFSISDTASDILADLGSLAVSHINSITATDVTPEVRVATYTTYRTALDKLTGRFESVDTAADIAAALNGLTDPKIASIVVSDNAPIGVDINQITGDSAILAKTSDADGSSSSLAVTDTAADISGDLDNLDGSNIASIPISDNKTVAVNAGQVTSDAVAIGKLVDASGAAAELAVLDTAANISKALDNLDGSNISSITISDNKTIAVHVAQVRATPSRQASSSTPTDHRARSRSPTRRPTFPGRWTVSTAPTSSR